MSTSQLTDYDQFAAEWHATRRQTWGELAFSQPLLKSPQILDAGCGNGRLLTFLHQKNFSGAYLGVDLSKKLLEFAQKDFPQAQFRQVDIANFCASQQFTGIFCIAVLHHFAEHQTQEKVLENFYQSLKPGGQIFLTNWNLWQMKFWPYLAASLRAGRFRDCRIPFGKQKIPRQLFALRKKDLRQILTKIGFREIQIFYASGAQKTSIWKARNLICLARK